MTSHILRLLLLVFVLFAAACTPAQSPYSGGGTSRGDPNADARWLLGAGKCLATFDDLQAGETEPHIQYVSGEPAADNPKFMAVRKPILDELLSYSKASDKADKEKHAQSLRELFQSISTAAARPFETMLETDDVLAVTFRTVLKGDALRDELLGVLQKKYAPPAPPPPPAPAQTSTPSLALPAVTLTDEASFGELHKAVKEQIDKIEGAAKGLSRSATVLCKERFEKITVPSMRNLLADTEKTKTQAFEETDASKRAKGLKKAGDQYLGAFYLTQIVLLELNFILVADWADGREQGVPSVDPLNKVQPMLAQPVRDYEKDEDILTLLQAAGAGDADKIVAALPKGTARFQHHLQFLDKWIVSVQKGAVLSKKVIAVANAAMIAISIYQVWKMPVLVGGGTPPPPAVVGAFPGGVAIGSRVSVASVASMLEAIRRLVAIGALDGALVGGLSTLGGSPGAAVPELQQPSLSVQNPGQGGGSGGQGSGAPAAVAAQPADLQPYSKGAGHHVPAKRAFEGAPGYDANKALAVPKAELERLGIAHPVGRLTNAQREAYQALAKTGKLPTWEEIARIETNALVEAGMKPDMAQATVAKAIKALKDAGVAGPVRTPWGK